MIGRGRRDRRVRAVRAPCVAKRAAATLTGAGEGFLATPARLGGLSALGRQ
jgi:hypothetical protein